MSGILAVFRRDGAPLDRRGFDAAVARSAPRGADLAVHRDLAFAMARRSTPRDARDRADLIPRRDAATGRIVVADARLDDPEAVRRDLRLPPGTPDTLLLLHGWAAWGPSIADRIAGAWALIGVDPRERAVFAARDALGARPLHLAVTPELVVVATDAVTVAAATDAAPDPEQIALWLEHPTPLDDHTWWTGVRALPPGGWRVLGPDGDRAGRGFDPYAIRPVPRRDAAAHGEALLARLADAVGRALPEPGPPEPRPATGVLLSGGLDSSLITAIAGRLRPGRVRALSWTTTDPRADERAFASAVAKSAAVSLSTVPLDALDPLLDEDKAADALGEPNADPHAFHPLAAFATARRLGVGALLSGYGGDDVISMGYEAVGGYLRAGRPDRAWREATAVADAAGNTPLAILRAVGFPIAFPRAVAAWRGRRDPELRLVRPAHAAAVQARLAVAQPRDDDPAAWHASGLAGWLESWGMSTLDRLAMGAGISLRTPYLDLELARAALAVPWPDKLHDGFDRYPLRVVSEGLLPEEVRWRRGKAWFHPLLAARLRATGGARFDALAADPAALEPWIDHAVMRTRIAAWRGGSNQDLAGLYRCLTLSRWLARRA